MFATVQDLYNAAQNELGDQGGIFIDIVDVIQWYNEAVINIFVDAEFGRDTPRSYNLSPGDTTIAALNVARLQKIHNFVVDGRPLIQTTLAHLYEDVGYNIDFAQQGQPLYYWRESDPANLSSRLLKFWPACEVACTAVVSATIIPDSIAPDPASASTPLTHIPPVFMPDVLKFVVMRGHQKEKDFRASELLERQFNENAFARYDNAHEVSEQSFTVRPDPMDDYFY